MLQKTEWKLSALRTSLLCVGVLSVVDCHGCTSAWPLLDANNTARNTGVRTCDGGSGGDCGGIGVGSCCGTSILVMVGRHRRRGSTRKDNSGSSFLQQREQQEKDIDR